MGNEKIKILVVDDEKDVLRGLKDTLEHEHFNVDTAATGEEGIAKATRWRPDVMLLDLHLPDIDGFDVCRRIKQDENTVDIAIIVISTRSKVADKAVGLELGADDYMTKPYSDVELLARIRAVLRRKNGVAGAGGRPGRRRVFRDVSIDLDAHKTFVGKTVVTLTRKEFDLLALFVSAPGKVFRRASLLEMVWGSHVDSMQGTVDSHIKTLRKKLGRAGFYIETVPAVGYRWAEE